MLGRNTGRSDVARRFVIAMIVITVVLLPENWTDQN
jgi:hypothetical protein